MKRNILDYFGNKIGELELPDGTPESVWQKKLSIYASQPGQDEFKSITPRQVRLVLLSMGITNQMVVDAINQTIPSPEKELALIEWEYSIGFDRHAPFVSGVGAVLGLSDSQIDELWRQASQV